MWATDLHVSSQSPPDSSTAHSRRADLYINLSREENTFLPFPGRTTLHSFHKILSKKCEAIHFVCSTFCCLYSLKAENQFHLLISFLPAFVLYTCRGSRPVTFIHHLRISSLTVFGLLPGVTRLIFFNLTLHHYNALIGQA